MTPELDEAARTALLRKIVTRLRNFGEVKTSSKDGDWGEFFAGEAEYDNEDFRLGDERVFIVSQFDWDIWPCMARCNRVAVDPDGNVAAYDVED